MEKKPKEVKWEVQVYVAKNGRVGTCSVFPEVAEWLRNARAPSWITKILHPAVPITHYMIIQGLLKSQPPHL